MEVTKRKLVSVGDYKSGITNLHWKYIRGVFPKDSVPYVEPTNRVVEVEGKPVELSLWDVAFYPYKVRSIWCRGSDVFMLCFSVDNPESLERIGKKYVPELRGEIELLEQECLVIPGGARIQISKKWKARPVCPNVPIVLVGNKKELRNDDNTKNELAQVNQEPVKPEEGRAMAEKIGAFAYLECSARTGEGVKEVFETAARAALGHDNNKCKWCNRRTYNCTIL